MTPEIKAVVDAAAFHAENERLLQVARDGKAAHQAAIASINTDIQMLGAAVIVSKQALKDLTSVL